MGTVSIKLHNAPIALEITPLLSSRNLEYLKIQLAQSTSGDLTKAYVLSLHQTYFFPWFFFYFPLFSYWVLVWILIKDLRFNGLYYLGLQVN